MPAHWLPPFAEQLGMTITQLAPDQAAAELAVVAQRSNGFGILHGGALMTLADTLGGAATLGFVWVKQTRINTANYYVACINMQAFFESISPLRAPKLVWAVLVGVVVLALMLATDVISYVLVALAYQGAFVSAWVGVALAHVLLCGSAAAATEASPETLARLPAVNAVGMIAWLCGAASSLALMQTSGFPKTLDTPAALLISAAAYALLRRFGAQRNPMSTSHLSYT